MLEKMEIKKTQLEDGSWFTEVKYVYELIVIKLIDENGFKGFHAVTPSYDRMIFKDKEVKIQYNIGDRLKLTIRNVQQFQKSTSTCYYGIVESIFFRAINYKYNIPSALFSYEGKGILSNSLFDIRCPYTEGDIIEIKIEKFK